MPAPYYGVIASSAPLFANKLLRRAAEVTSAGTRWRRKRCCRRRGGGRNTGIQAEHCLRVTGGLTRGGRQIQGRRRERDGIYSLAGLSENFGCERRANQ
jgi:hypothetical protein